MAKNVLLNGVTRSERQAAISSVTEAVQRSGGWVDDVHLFSNVSVNLRFVISAKAVARLVEELTRTPIGLTPDDGAKLNLAASELAPDEEVTFSLQITFVHNEPDLRRHIPSVPS